MSEAHKFLTDLDECMGGFGVPTQDVVKLAQALVASATKNGCKVEIDAKHHVIHIVRSEWTDDFDGDIKSAYKRVMRDKEINEGVDLSKLKRGELVRHIEDGSLYEFGYHQPETGYAICYPPGEADNFQSTIAILPKSLLSVSPKPSEYN